MIKLLTLENLSAFSADAVYKICLTLEKYGMTDENIVSCAAEDELFSAAEELLSDGGEVIIAAEPSDGFNAMKQELFARFGIEPVSSPEISELSQNADNVFDAQLFSLVPQDGVVHLSADGLYSGFSCGIFSGRLTFVPLDFGRLTDILDSFITKCLEARQPAPEQNADYQEENNPFDFSEPVSQTAETLSQLGAKLALASGEAVSWIYDLYDRINNFSQTISFVEIEDTDEPEDSENEDGEDEPEKHESISAKTIRFAREAMRNAEADFGGAISDVYSAESEDGTVNYFAFVAVADKNGAKAKKINTASYDDAALLLPHCVCVLCETVCQKAEDFSPAVKTEKTDGKGDLKLSKNMLIFAAAIAVVAVITPIIILAVFLRGGSNDPSSITTTNDLQAFNPFTTTAPAEPQTTDSSLYPNLPGDETLPTIGDGTTAPAGNQPLEPPAADIAVQQTEPPIASKKGTFTFYVFGYGHGVGLSQHGANDLANQGWNAAQILSNYYYGAVLVSGDSYPKKIKYSGTEYDTRELLACALNAEMGDSFQSEALKAQVVAIYTYAKYYGFKELDGSDFAYKPGATQKIYNAVDEVMKQGLFITDNGGQTALTPFHSISAGYTTSYRNTWGSTEVSYLAGGRPSFGDYEAKDFKTTVTLTSDQFKTLVESKGMGITLSGDPASWISILSHDTAINDNIGYVSSVSVGGKIMTGNDFRQKLMSGSLRSHCFTVVYTPG